jgi:hypothetical protein
LPLDQGENRNRKLASPKDKSSSFHSPLIREVGGKQRFSGRR